MNSHTSDSILEKLRVSRDAFMAAASGVTEAQAKFRPAQDRWSIEDCVEHLALAERVGLGRISKDYTHCEALHRPEREADIARFMADRTSKRSAPEPIRPTGRFASFAQSLDQFASGRDEIIAYVTACPDDLRTRLTVHPFLGTITCYEFLCLVAEHPLRHVEQIREIKTHPGYPC